MILYAAIGYGGLVLSHLMPRIKDAYAKQASNFAERELEKLKKAPLITKNGAPVIVEGIETTARLRWPNAVIRCPATILLDLSPVGMASRFISGLCKRAGFP